MTKLLAGLTTSYSPTVPTAGCGRFGIVVCSGVPASSTWYNDARQAAHSSWGLLRRSCPPGIAGVMRTVAEMAALDRDDTPDEPSDPSALIV